MSLLLPVIMCGGAGTRMWPESRESLPKQFIPLIGTLSTFQTTASLFTDRSLFLRPLVISNREYRFQVAEQLAEIGVAADIVLEPARRDSGPAVAVAAEIAAARDPKTIVLVMAADHNVVDRAGLVGLFAKAAEAASEGYIVTLGVRPTFPATGYGYIKTGRRLNADTFAVEAFVEKPDEETARRYIKENYLWNSGNFIFSAGLMRSEIAAFEPDMAAAATAAVEGAVKDLDFLTLDAAAFARAPKKSIDYAIMERTSHAAVLPADVGWSDLGTWSAVHDLSPQDESGNAIRGRGVIMHGSGVMVRSEGHLTAVVGVDNVVVVSTQDAILVLGAAHADKVKDLVDQLRADNRPEALAHKRMYRPWGYYQSIDQGDRYQVKRIVVKPQGRLSLQRHHHRAEHWIVVRGTAEVSLDDKVTLMHENESIYLPIGAVHRLGNPGKIDLELIEVQTGSYLGEDDIVRIDDVYNRV